MQKRPCEVINFTEVFSPRDSRINDILLLHYRVSFEIYIIQCVTGKSILFALV